MGGAALVIGMHKFTSILALWALTMTASAGPDPKSRSIDQFAGRLHSEVGKTKGNLIYSPKNIGIAHAMTREGATGETAAQMDAVLGKTTGADAKALGRSMKSSPKADKNAPKAPELAVANRLFLDKSMPLVKRFVDITRDEYGAPIETVDYIGDREAARLKINRWVEDQTKGRIKDLIAKGILTNLSRLV